MQWVNNFSCRTQLFAYSAAGDLFGEGQIIFTSTQGVASQKRTALTSSLSSSPALMRVSAEWFQACSLPPRPSVLFIKVADAKMTLTLSVGLNLSSILPPYTTGPYTTSHATISHVC